MMLLKCENLSVEYEGKKALSDISFSVSKGDYVCIIGENGSGKSTLINSILGLSKVSNGNIVYQNGLTNKEIGYLAQKSQIKNDFPASVYEIVMSGFAGSTGKLPFYGSKHRQKAKKYMNMLEISDIKNKSFNTLSGGQKQRVLLSRALCSAKKLLVLDEPVSGLDPIAQNCMYETVNMLNKKEKITVIMVSHDLDTACKYSNKILHLKTEQLFFGSSDKYMKTDFKDMFLGGGYNA